MELTNNEFERDLRRWVLDRKTWLFVGHDQSAERAADTLTLITTCKKLGLDPRRYLRDTLAKILAGERTSRRSCPSATRRRPPRKRWTSPRSLASAPVGSRQCLRIGVFVRLAHVGVDRLADHTLG